MPVTTSWGLPIVLLVISNVFMTFAWYGHLKHKGAALGQVILIRWGIAFFEHRILVPANRWGSSLYSPYPLKIVREGVALLVFLVFAFLSFGVMPRWNPVAAFFCILAAVGFNFLPRPR
jgi:uncharacterized protein (DUF486 family)